jgi:hypothetical protein
MNGNYGRTVNPSARGRGQVQVEGYEGELSETLSRKQGGGKLNGVRSILRKPTLDILQH